MDSSDIRSPGGILHVDMDAFFASVEQRDRPELQGKPVVVGAPADKRGVVSTASYEARVFGIHSAMPSRTAARLCPQAIFLPVDGPRYQAASQQIMEILRDITPFVEQVSIDEAFLDVNGVLATWDSPRALAQAIKRRIRDETGLTASVGVADNKFLAKLSSDLEKPDGLTESPSEPEAIRRFLAPLPVARLWGVGPAAEKRLKRFGMTTVEDLQQQDRAHLERWFGDLFGAHLWHLARGLDDRPVVTEQEAKSFSNEHTFGIDCDNSLVVRQCLIELTENVGRRLRKAGKHARTGAVKLRFADFRTISRQQALQKPTDTDQDLLDCALDLFDRERVRKPVRLIGFGVFNLADPAGHDPEQQELFPSEDDPAPERRRALDSAVDRIRSRFGVRALRRGASSEDAAESPADT